MATIDEASFPLRLFLRAYRWRRIEPLPWADLKKPLSAARIGLVSTAGFTLPDQPPFDSSIKGGDYSLRIVPADAVVRRMTSSHRSESFDHSGIEQDPNLAFPLDRMRELVEEGTIGEVTPRVASIMGSITATARFVRTTAPAIARLFIEDRADAALLVPV